MEQVLKQWAEWNTLFKDKKEGRGGGKMVGEG